MEETNSFNWAFDWEPVLSIGSVLRVLRRAIPLVEDIQQDLPPFRSSIARWSQSDPYGLVPVAGVLAQASVGGQAVRLVVLEIGGSGSTQTFEVEARYSAKLTVWQVDEQLDLFQLRFAGHISTVSGQAGGERLLPLFASWKGSATRDHDVLDVIRPYETGDAPSSRP